MIALFFMSIPLENYRNKPVGENGEVSPVKGENELMDIILENGQCDEIKLQLESDGVTRILATQKICVSEDTNIEKICRQFANQDILIKIRNGKKLLVERTRILKP